MHVMQVNINYRNLSPPQAVVRSWLATHKPMDFIPRFSNEFKLSYIAKQMIASFWQIQKYEIFLNKMLLKLADIKNMLS
jgi:hypothetical protein